MYSLVLQLFGLANTTHSSISLEVGHTRGYTQPCKSWDHKTDSLEDSELTVMASTYTTEPAHLIWTASLKHNEELTVRARGKSDSNVLDEFILNV